jgi:hypothetical protein
VSNDELRDQLPDDLNVAAFSGPYEFPDNSRRRIPGYLYIGMAIACLVFRAFGPTDSALMGKGWVGAAILLGAFGLFSISSGWRMTVDEKHALVLATRAIGLVCVVGPLGGCFATAQKNLRCVVGWCWSMQSMVRS